MSTRCSGLGTVSIIGSLLVAVGCGEDTVVQETMATSSANGAAPRLKPPPEYVLAPDGTTQQTLEQAGILQPDGRAWGRVLGKALFWDQQAGSDGNACAGCHFSAGADPRIKNQLSPGFNDVSFGPDGDHAFGSVGSDTGEIAAGQMPSGAWAGANYTLKPEDFPLHRLWDTRDRNSKIRTTTNDVVSSQGSFDTSFTRIRIAGRSDKCDPAGTVFSVNGLAARQVEPRNTPTTINAAFFHSNFWDGRANNMFNGIGVFGPRDLEDGDPNNRLLVLEGGELKTTSLQVRNASLASQAVGPPLSAKEMSCNGRTFADVGRRLLKSLPLFGQKVARTDSVLGLYVSPSGKGLRPEFRYADLIMKTFDPKYWAATGRYRIVDGKPVADPTGYTQMELNFSMFWGLSIMMYEQTLISDQSRFDDWFERCRPVATNPGGADDVPIANPVVTCRIAPEDPTDPRHGDFTAQEVLGFALFNNGGAVGGPPSDPPKLGIRSPGNPACSGCHPVTSTALTSPLVFPTFSEAAFQAGDSFVPVERSLIVDQGFGLPLASTGGVHQRGFFNLGLRPASDDLGNGGTDPYGNPLSIARMFLHEQAGETVVDPTGIGNRCTTPTLLEPGGTPRFPGCPGPNDPPLPPNTLPPPLAYSGEKELVDGTFKTPSIRNVGLTPPYFHYGGYADLRSVVEVYVRGGNKRNMLLTVPDATGDSTGTGPLGKGPAPAAGPNFGTNVDFFIRDVKSTDAQIDALVAFMLTLTDPRVQCDQAPFDHPELTVLNGHATTDLNGDGKADDVTFTLPAVGANGYAGGANARFCIANAGDLFAPGMGARRGE